MTERRRRNGNRRLPGGCDIHGFPECCAHTGHATHERHLTHALTEFTGLDPDKITFDILLSADLGVDPIAEVVKLWNIERSGQAVPLTVGTKGYGKYRWNILKHEMKMKTFYGNGDVHTATVSVSLQEYLGG